MGWDEGPIPWDGMGQSSDPMDFRLFFFKRKKNKFFPVEIRIQNTFYEEWLAELIIISLSVSLQQKQVLSWLFLYHFS
jgi:hypothetical protein